MAEANAAAEKRYGKTDGKSEKQEEEPKFQAKGEGGHQERHRAERKEMHKRHREARRDLHGQHRGEHDDMHGRHENEIADMEARHEAEMGGGAEPAAGGEAA